VVTQSALRGVCFDAPPYDVVRACEGEGYCSPCDVRWCRVSLLLEQPEPGARHIGHWLRRWFCHRPARWEWRRLCGHPLPPFQAYGFVFEEERTCSYLLSQCSRCHTIFWDDG
jgi:hypothetical protein